MSNHQQHHSTENFYKNLSLWYEAMGVDSVFGDELHDYLAEKEKIIPSTITPPIREPEKPIINLDDINNIDECAKALQSNDDVALQTLKDTSREFLFFDGNQKSNIMLVSANGDYDDKKANHFFTGDKGVLLNNMLKAIDLSLDQLFHAHIVPWCPIGGHATKDYIDACLPYMQKLIALKKPKFLLILGHAAASNLLIDYGGAIKSYQQIYQYNNDIKAITLASLREILQQEGNIKRRVWHNLLLFQHIIKEYNHD